MATKFRSGTIMYGASPKVQLGQVNIGNVLKAIAGKAGAGVPVKTDKAMKLVKDAEAKRKQGKCLNPIAQVGVVGKDLVFAIFADKKYDESAVLVKNWEKVLTDSVLAGKVVNLDPKDPIIAAASKILAKKHGTTAKTGDEANLKKVDKAPIVIVAHGGSAESRGKVYAKKFAEKSPKDLVKFLVKDKKLPKAYAGTLYLDGCFTAAGKTDKNYAKKVHGLLVKVGFKYITVKGNLGAAATMDDGREAVIDAQEEKKAKGAVKSLQRAWDKIWNDSYAATNDVDGFFADPKTKALIPKIAKAKKKVEEMEKTYKHDIIDLVGTFGPEKLRKHKWYNKIFK
jgi:hypothetical protein